MSKMKKVLLMCTAYVLVAALAIGGTIAYLQDDDSDVHVMTLGNVSIAQHEYERVVDANGDYVVDSSVGGYKLQPFTQDKPLYPATIPTTSAAWTYESTNAMFEQVGANGGGMQVFVEPNAVDKFVFVENTGKTDAYVRTLIAYESGSLSVEEWDEVVCTSYHFSWGDPVVIGSITVENNNYVVLEYTYKGRPDKGFHENGILPAGEVTQCSLGQVYMRSTATNEDCEAIDGNKDGKYDILVLSQAVQAAGFADAKTALDTAFGKSSEKAAEWFGGVIVPRVKTLAELREALATGGEFALANDIVVEKSDLLYKADGGHSDGSAFFVKNDTIIDLNGHNIIVNSGNVWTDVFFMNFGADLTITGEGDIKADCSIACVYDANSTLNVEGGNFYVTANNDMLYAIYGKINVSGGTFTTSYWNTINIYGSGRVDRVDVSGGSFENWNPASSPDGNLLADGYKVVSEVVDGVTWYTVVAE